MSTLWIQVCRLNRRHSWIWHTIRHKEFALNILQGAIFGKKAVGRPGLRYLKQVARNTGADNYTAMERMACNNCRWKAANQSKDWGIRKTFFTALKVFNITFAKKSCERVLFAMSEILCLQAAVWEPWNVFVRNVTLGPLEFSANCTCDQTCC